MPGMIVEGEWMTERQWQNTDGRFVHPATSFRGWITADGSSGFPAEAGRYHLYVAWACLWAHRIAILRKLKGLEEAVGLSAVGSFMGEDGWAFYDEPGVIPDTVSGAFYLREVYAKADPGYTGRVTTLVLWDKETETIVNNESREIIRMLDTEFGEFAATDADFYPADLREEIDASIDAIYEPTNNGVYRSGFATPARRLTGRPSRSSSTPWTAGRECSKSSATSAGIASPRPTGASSPRSCASTPSTTAISSATSGASWTTRTSEAT